MQARCEILELLSKEGQTFLFQFKLKAQGSFIIATVDNFWKQIFSFFSLSSFFPGVGRNGSCQERGVLSKMHDAMQLPDQTVWASKSVD